MMLFDCGKRTAGICVVLGLKQSSTYPSEYASCFFEPEASTCPHLLYLATKDYSDRLLGQWLAPQAAIVGQKRIRHKELFA